MNVLLICIGILAFYGKIMKHVIFQCSLFMTSVSLCAQGYVHCLAYWDNLLYKIDNMGPLFDD